MLLFNVIEYKPINLKYLLLLLAFKDYMKSHLDIHNAKIVTERVSGAVTPKVPIRGWNHLVGIPAGVRD
jgi:hypothetical protein